MSKSNNKNTQSIDTSTTCHVMSVATLKSYKNSNLRGALKALENQPNKSGTQGNLYQNIKQALTGNTQSDSGGTKMTRISSSSNGKEAILKQLASGDGARQTANKAISLVNTGNTNNLANLFSHGELV